MPIKFRSSLSITALTLTLASCGGGGDSSTPGNTTPPATVRSIDPYGIVASGSAQPISIAGTNFVNGMSVGVTNKNGNNYTVSSVLVTSSTAITANVTIPTVPADNYINVNVKSSSGATLDTTILGVASEARTLLADVQPIFDAKCRSCHTGTANGNLDMSSYDASKTAGVTGLIGILSSGCLSKFRVVVGDARPNNSVLINKITTASPCSGDPMPPVGSPQLTSTEIQTIIDWVAGGAN